jgi:hypothetical protein
MRDLAVIVPSRGRPQNIADLVTAWDATSTCAASLVVAVDDDDPELGGYRDLGLELRGDITLAVQEAPGTMVAALNQAARVAASRHFAVGFLGDDHRPRTRGWDAAVLAELKQLGTGVVTGPDGYREDHLPTWCAMTSNIIRTLGYMAPPGLKHLAVDNAWLTLASAIGAFSYLPGVLVEHMHPFAGKAQMDAGYARVNAGSMYSTDLAEFERWIREDLPAAVEKLGAGR